HGDQLVFRAGHAAAAAAGGALSRPCRIFRFRRGAGALPRCRTRRRTMRSAVIAQGWLFWALLSAVFAALTTVFARVGVAGIDADLATLLRTVLILLLLTALVAVRRKWQNPALLPPRTLLFLALSALATGLSWLC